MIKRLDELQKLQNSLKNYPVTAIVGARQVGKTTLARDFGRTYKGPVEFFDLEDPRDFARLEDPILALEQLNGLVIIDEIQNKPEIFPILRVLADRKHSKTKFIILGSASRNLIQKGTESLAGRINYHELGGFGINEVGIKNTSTLWLRGGFPDSFLAKSIKESMNWRRNFISSFLERDIPKLGFYIHSNTLRKFWSMVAHYHGQTWNSSEIAGSFGVTDKTVKHYLDILTDSLVIRQIQPWHENINKRQVKAPKIYIKDTGILHTLMNLYDYKDLETHPKLGASWEGFVIEQIIRILNLDYNEYYFWAVHSGAELDLLTIRGRKRFGFEIKRTSSPKLTTSINNAVTDLKLQKIYLIYAGDKTFKLSKNIIAVGFNNIQTILDSIDF